MCLFFCCIIEWVQTEVFCLFIVVVCFTRNRTFGTIFFIFLHLFYPQIYYIKEDPTDYSASRSQYLEFWPVILQVIVLFVCVLWVIGSMKYFEKFTWYLCYNCDSFYGEHVLSTAMCNRDALKKTKGKRFCPTLIHRGYPIKGKKQKKKSRNEIKSCC